MLSYEVSSDTSIYSSDDVISSDESSPSDKSSISLTFIECVFPIGFILSKLSQFITFTAYPSLVLGILSVKVFSAVLSVSVTICFKSPSLSYSAQIATPSKPLSIPTKIEPFFIDVPVIFKLSVSGFSRFIT